VTAVGDDVVFVRDLPVDCIIGLNRDERVARQRLLVSVELTSDFAAAARDDDLDSGLDYVSIAEQVKTIATNGQFRLIETLAVRVAEKLLESAAVVVVEIEKPAALAATRRAGVRVRRARSGE
jgi:dihydroneopterin aldolase